MMQVVVLVVNFLVTNFRKKINVNYSTKESIDRLTGWNEHLSIFV
jgi:hypothetical protein